MNESEIGGNGCMNGVVGTRCGTSAHYSLDQFVDTGGSSLGESAVGNSASASYQTNGGFSTTETPGLMMTVNSSVVSLLPNPMTSSSGSFGAATFDIRDYTSSGYAV